MKVASGKTCVRTNSSNEGEVRPFLLWTLVC